MHLFSGKRELDGEMLGQAYAREQYSMSHPHSLKGKTTDCLFYIQMCGLALM